MLCIMQNHIIQAFASSGNTIKPVSFIRDLKSRWLPSPAIAVQESCGIVQPGEKKALGRPSCSLSVFKGGL